MIARTAQDLGLLIRSRRRELGLGQGTLAQRVGVSRLWIIEFERGKPRAEIGLVLRTLTALGLALSVSVEGTPTDTVTAPPRVEPVDIDSIVRRSRKR